MNPGQERGRDLERRIAEFLQSRDYQVQTNVVLQGRSGASHELDVIGDKSDGLTTFRLVVECKAWTAPIDKDVVFKLAGVLADLGAAKGVIATLAGWTAQAEQTAIQASIELWGQDELVEKLGQPALTDLRVGPTPVQALGIPFSVSADVASANIARLAKGRLGLGRDEVTWSGPVFLPVWILQIALTQMAGFIKKVPRITRIWSSYEAVAGRLTATYSSPPQLANIDLSSGHIRPLLSQTKVQSPLEMCYTKWRQVTTPAAKARYSNALAAHGITMPVDGFAVESGQMSYIPLWVAFLRRGSQERLVAVDGVTGKERSRLGEVLTANAQKVRDSLRVGQHGA